MKKRIIILFSLLIIHDLYGQENADSLRQQANTADDKGKIESLINLTRYYKWTIPDSSIYFAMQGLPIAKK